VQAAAKILYRLLDGIIDPAVSPADRKTLDARLMVKLTRMFALFWPANFKND